MIDLESYIGQYIENDNSIFGYQSVNLTNDYIIRLTDGVHQPYQHAKNLKFDDIPKDWSIITRKQEFNFRRGDIIVVTDEYFGFNAIVVDVDSTNDEIITVISMNSDGKADKPVEQHEFNKCDIDYIVRPDLETLIDKGITQECENFKQNNRTRKEIIVSDNYAVKINNTMILKSTEQITQEFVYTFTNKWVNALFLSKERADIWAEKLGGYTVKVTEKLEIEE